ncbi:MAG: amino acid ABC transporter permease [Acidimicrobiales bacterium]
MSDPTEATVAAPARAATRPTGPTRRQLAERAQRRRAALIATISSVVVFGVVGLLVVSSPGWGTVRQAFFSGADFRASFPDILRAFALNVKMFLIAEAFILVCSLGLALAKSSRAPVLFPLRLASTVYVDVFRGIPSILVLLLLGFGMPALQIGGLPTDPVFWGIVALVMSYSAYVAEVFRSGIDSVHESQRAAARSLGLTSAQTMRYVLLPQGVRRVIPPLLNDFIALQKETALISVIGPIEAARQAGIYTARTFNYTSYVAAACIFIAITIPQTRFVDHLIVRQQRRTGGRVAA